MRFFRFKFIITCVALLLSGCGNDSHSKYRKGYDAAWSGKPPTKSSWISKEEKQGYQDGFTEATLYDERYDDGFDSRRPKYTKDLVYMEGYKDGKKDKKCY